MQRKEKVAIVDNLKQKLENARSVFLTDFSGIDVKDISDLRKSLRGSSLEYLVAKNTLIKRAVAELQLKQLEPYLNGPTALVIAGDDGVAAARIITKFAETHETFKFKAGMMAEKVIDAGQVKSIASLPPREVLLARLLGTLNAPVTSLVYVLNETIARLVRTLDQVSQAKQSQENI